jgi:hypothetical protein
MEHVRAILAGDKPASGRQVFPVIWSDARREQLRRTASGEIASYSGIDQGVSQYLLFCADGAFFDAEIGILRILQDNLDVALRDGEVFISLLNALFVVQRLDLVGAMLRDRFGFPGNVNLAFGDIGIGVGVMQWEISPDRVHRFTFDAAALREDNTRNEILNFYWQFPCWRIMPCKGKSKPAASCSIATTSGRSRGWRTVTIGRIISWYQMRALCRAKDINGHERSLRSAGSHGRIGARSLSGEAPRPE